MEYMVETHALQKNYKKNKALQGVDMHIEKGAIYGLIGKNGAGKTTLMRILCGLQKPTSGSYTILGTTYPHKEIQQARKRIGAIIETPSTYLEMTAEDNMKEQYTIIGLPSYEGLTEILTLVGLQNTGKKKVKHFSLGMKQRLGIAIALVGNPDILLLDEPTNGLDPQGIVEIRELIITLNQEKGITFLISSHYLDELSKIATHYGFMNHGTIIQEIASKALQQNSQKRIELCVSNLTECVKYLEEQHKPYEVISDYQVNIYAPLSITEIAVALANKNCTIQSYQEKEASLENYYMNIMGGEDNV